MDMTTYNISIEKTSNEHIIKFATDTFLTEAESYEFSNADEAAISPLASQLFKMPFVKTVFVSQNFIALEKLPITDWDSVQEVIAEVIRKYLDRDRKSTRLNSSHVAISYAVFCL